MNKKIEELEKALGVVLPKQKPSTIISDAEFKKLAVLEGVGVDYKNRVEFLKKNGYEVTRENLVDSSLSFKEK